MANMSYCMFQNTVGDLRECSEAEGLYEPELLGSDEERRARRRLIELCKQIAAEFEDDE